MNTGSLAPNPNTLSGGTLLIKGHFGMTGINSSGYSVDGLIYSGGNLVIDSGKMELFDTSSSTNGIINHSTNTCTPTFVRGCTLVNRNTGGSVCCIKPSAAANQTYLSYANFYTNVTLAYSNGSYTYTNTGSGTAQVNSAFVW
jgi:hypothetical protein